MSRNGSGVYSKPPGTTAASGEVIASAMFNAAIDDIASDLNVARPISAGGTGATSRAAAQIALDVVPQSSLTDDTALRLMRLGAWGWGGTASVAVTGEDCDQLVRTGIFTGTADTTENMPTDDEAYTIYNLARNATSCVQVAFSFTGPVYYRTKAGSFSDWREYVGILESGTNANGTYVKYVDGRIECENFVTFTAAIDTAFLGGYRCAAQTWTFPTTFASAPAVFIQPAILTGFSGIRTAASTTTQAFYAVTAITSQTSASRSVSLHARGA